MTSENEDSQKPEATPNKNPGSPSSSPTSSTKKAPRLPPRAAAAAASSSSNDHDDKLLLAKGASLEKQPPKSRHRPTVSWGDVGVPASQAALLNSSHSHSTSNDDDEGGGSLTDVPGLGNKTKTVRQLKLSVSLKDVMGASPVESEAETLILQSLEQFDNHRNRNRTASTEEGSMSTHKTDDAMSGGLLVLPHVPSPPDAPSSDATTTSNKNTTTTQHRAAERISELASSLYNLHQTQNETTPSSSSAPNTTQGDDNLLPPVPQIGPSDAFIKNAVKVMDVLPLATVREEEVEINFEDVPLVGGGDVESGGGSDMEQLGAAAAANASDGNNNNGKNSGGANKKGGHQHKNIFFSRQFRAFVKDYKLFGNYWHEEDQSQLLRTLRSALIYLVIPCAGVAALLFYVFDNPPCGTEAEECRLVFEIKKNQTLPQQVIMNVTSDGNSTVPPAVVDDTDKIFAKTFEPIEGATVSWWLLFLGVRLPVTLMLAVLTQSLVVDYLALRTTAMLRCLGSMLTLFLVQSKGWPFVLGTWFIYNFALLYGSYDFPKHWLYWQDLIDLMNDNNYAGTVLESTQYARILICGVLFSALVSLKRFWLGLWLGRQTYRRYSKDLAKVMAKVLWIGKVAKLAGNLQEEAQSRASSIRGSEKVKDMLAETVTSDDGTNADTFVGDHLGTSAEVKISELLGEFEEPESAEDEMDEKVNVSDIIQFRQSLSFLNTPYPFSMAFGRADTRENCLASTEQVYKALLSNSDTPVLHFNTIARLAVQRDDSLDELALKELIRLFRPDREGNLTLLDFAKSIDSTYKELHLLRASIKNSSRIDRVFESFVHVIFYFVLVVFGLSILGLDPWVLFASISGLVISFSFMIGSACSKVVEGMLLILIRKPYDIGDRIAVSDVNNDTPDTGSFGWIVKDVGLFSTTVIYGSSNETATYTNSSLAGSRIINAARSPRAFLHFNIRFPIDTDYAKIQVFKSCIEKFVVARPREWVSFSAFRTTRIEVDRGFIEYKVGAIHRESWQQIGALLNSKSDLSSFALELSKQMGMRYQSPPMPIDLNMRPANIAASVDMPVDASHRKTSSTAYNAVAALFEGGDE